jgi:hypothetical protein
LSRRVLAIEESGTGKFLGPQKRSQRRREQHKHYSRRSCIDGEVDGEGFNRR